MFGKKLALFVCVVMLLTVGLAYATEVVLGSNSASVGTILYVSPKPGNDPLTNGTALLNALSGITDNGPGTEQQAPYTSRYLIKLGPGIYDLGSNSLQMKQYVSIEGSGETATKITAAVTSSSYPATGTVMGVNNAELRFLTVENTGTDSFTVAILNLASSPSIIHVTATASGSGGTEHYGIYNTSSSPTMTNVTATASGGFNSYGVSNNNSSSPTMTNVIATASGATNCRGVNNNSSSPTMTNVIATASGASSSNIGVLNFGSSPTMTNVTATSSGGTDNDGVYNSSSSPTMTNVIATASGASNSNVGVVNNSGSSPTMSNVTVTGNDGAISYGVVNSSGTMKINHSVIKGTTSTISNAPFGATTLVGNTQLDGGAVINSIALTCVGVYSANYASLSNTCQ